MQLIDHKLPGRNEALEISILDEPGQGGACHVYQIKWPASGDVGTERHQFAGAVLIHFQNGPILETGINGVSNEALLAVVIDRIRSFQAGPYSCRENAVALTYLESSLMWLQKRTRDRIVRGVEGTNAK